MKIYINRAQLARHLNIDPRNLTARIERGEIKPDAYDEQQRELFDKSKHAKPQSKRK